MDSLLSFLNDRKRADLLSWGDQVEASARFSLDTRAIELIALQNGVLPARYQRNRRTVSAAGQLKLFNSQVAVIGCGGLGGYVIEQLCRLGVGRIVAIDPDLFEEHNLNRQILSTVADLGRPKVTVAKERVREINPAVELIAIQDAFSMANGRQLLHETQVVVDALDRIEVRVELAQLCEEMNLPLVHGAIAGWYGQVCTQLPGDGSVQTIYRGHEQGGGIEKELGNPAFTPAVVASLEAAEACKIILGEGELIRGRKLLVDLLGMEFHNIAT